MSKTSASILSDPLVRATREQAWQDALPGIAGGHEEGGFVVQDSAGSLKVVRWPIGAQNSIILPPHPGCQIGGDDIVASFHTHPNLGSDFLQEPGETDKRSVRSDPDLKGAEYVGEFVISEAIIYMMTPAGQVREVSDTQTFFAEK